MKKYQNIFWDWNGTLLDDVDECIEIINASLAKRQLKLLEPVEYLEKFQFPVKNYYEAIGFDFSKESFEEAGKEFIKAYSHKMFSCRLHHGAIEVLQLLGQSGANQFVLSALNEDALNKCIVKFGLQKYFSAVRGLDDHYAYSKVELGMKMISDLKIPSDSAVLIGDTLHDFEVAQALGIDCILVASGHNSRERLSSCNSLVFSSLAELKSQIEENL